MSLSKQAIQQDAHLSANLTGAACYYIPIVCCLSSLVKYYSMSLMKTTNAIISDPNANEPSCLNERQIDLQIGAVGYPPSKNQIATDELVQYRPIASRKNTILHSVIGTKAAQICTE